jgi:hypothetical protein
MSNSSANDIPSWTFSLEIEFDEIAYNASQSRDPITFHGWLNWTGYSVREINVHLYGTCSLNDVYLSQYDFSFHLPQSIPFTGFIPIPQDLNSTKMVNIIFTAIAEQGATQSSGSVQASLIVRYWEPEENNVTVSLGSQSNPNYPLIFGLPSLLLFFLVLLYFKMQKLKGFISIVSDKLLIFVIYMP